MCTTTCLIYIFVHCIKESVPTEETQELWVQMKSMIDKGMAQDALALTSSDRYYNSPVLRSYEVMIQVARSMVIILTSYLVIRYI
jgi:hypothetical protein